LRVREGRLGRAVEAIYADDIEHDGWLANVARALRALLDTEVSLFGSYRWDRAASIAKFATPPTSNVPALAHIYPELQRPYDGERYRRVFCGPPVQTMAEAFEGDRAIVRHLGDLGFPDHALALSALDADDEGCIVALPMRVPVELTGAERTLLGYLTAHLTAAHRARRHRGASEAIFSPGGKVAHAELAAQKSLDELREMVRLSERARWKSASAAEALAAWTAIVQGRWSLVETFDSDGRRHIAARENEPRPRAAFAAPALTPAQLSALTLLGRGYAQKAIAYELGLSTARVSRLLGAARRALGIETRAELAQVAREALTAPQIGEWSMDSTMISASGKDGIRGW
jgi:DNA-binding CsgD family transcriptional regulator